MNMFDLTGRLALITGSSRGIGRAIAEGYVAAGARVVINGRDAAAVAATVKALGAGLGIVRPTGIVVQIGIAGGEMSLPMNIAVAKEIELRGTFRFHEEFTLAVALIGGGLVDVMPLLSATMPLADANEAFALAADRSKAMKVQLAFG